ncbi:metallophosphoesterase family protein [Acidicapsa dinghuensis]|uniref:Phosphoesterase n=1 Tax=Acidicapsa dinghuensis TaxID=2218256 RepID=A0ABW1EFR9_9BACT|nr:metallophosphoesterase family protein [Acidicapsa dinghuensis]
MKIAVVSDTHGLLRPELLPMLGGAEHILHLGDVGDPAILTRLAEIAPVTAIRGNVDTDGVCGRLPETEVVTINGQDLYMLHDVHDLDLDPVAAGFAAVLFGHSHKPEIRRHKGVVYFNPGSCGPRRFQLPITFGWLQVAAEGELIAEIVTLPVNPH